MLIDLVHEDAEEKLLAVLEQANRKNLTGGALHFYLSRLPAVPKEEDLLLTVRPSLEDKPAAIYFLRSGDIVITWKGVQKATLEDLCHRLYERYADHAVDKLHGYFDLQAQAEELRLVLKRTMAAPPPKAVAAKQAPGILSVPAAVTPSAKQLAALRTALTLRKSRRQPEILVVEDQAFSKKLLVDLLGRTYKTRAAADASQALETYCLYAPDLVFLDIELPDANGHALAEALRRIDPHAYIVMVTANNYAQDVLRAKSEGVRGFIAKPYNKQKIEESLDIFLRQRKG